MIAKTKIKRRKTKEERTRRKKRIKRVNKTIINRTKIRIIRRKTVRNGWKEDKTNRRQKGDGARKTVTKTKALRRINLTNYRAPEAKTWENRGRNRSIWGKKNAKRTGADTSKTNERTVTN